jgi:hypothetical protein
MRLCSLQIYYRDMKEENLLGFGGLTGFEGEHKRNS